VFFLTLGPCLPYTHTFRAVFSITLCYMLQHSVWYNTLILLLFISYGVYLFIITVISMVCGNSLIYTSSSFDLFSFVSLLLVVIHLPSVNFHVFN